MKGNMDRNGRVPALFKMGRIFRSTRNRQYYSIVLAVSLFVVIQLGWMSGFLNTNSPRHSSVTFSSSSTSSSSYIAKVSKWLSWSTSSLSSATWIPTTNLGVSTADSFCRFGPIGLSALVREQLPKANETLLPTIPPNLIFIHDRALFETQKPRVLYENLQSTIHAYETLYAEQPEASVTATTTAASSLKVIRITEDSDCRRLIYQAVPDMVQYFDAAERQRALGQQHRLDMCRMAALYQHGGYYFNLDLVETVTPFLVKNPSIRFVGVKEVDVVEGSNSMHLRGGGGSVSASNLLFQGFMAAAPGHPLLRQAMEEMIKVLVKQQETSFMSSSRDGSKTRKKRGLGRLPSLGAMGMARALEAVSSKCGQSDVQLLQQSQVKSKYDFFNFLSSSSDSTSPLAKISGATCPFAVHDRFRKAYFRTMKQPTTTNGKC